MPQQIGVSDDPVDRGERMVRRDGEHEVHLAQRLHLHLSAVRRHALRRDADADREVGLAIDQRLPRAGQHLGAQTQPRAGSAPIAQCVERLAQLEHRDARHHAVYRNRQLRFPAGGHPLDAVGDGIHLLEQAPPFVEQFLAGSSQPGLARAPVEQQHIERVFELAHVVGQRRRHLAELACRRGEAAGAGDDIHHRQRFRGEDVAGCAHRSSAAGFLCRFILFERRLQHGVAVFSASRSYIDG